jgi:hypothetical protein
MNSREMHYDFKQKLNKIDSQKYRNLKVPEIDWKLVEAQEILCKVIAQPRLASQLGFEVNQRTINDIRTVVVDQKPSEAITTTVFDETSVIAALPVNYWFLAKAQVYATQGKCVDVILDTREVQHDDRHERSPFDKSSFEWRIVNMRFNQDGLRFFHDETFSITKARLEYLRKPRRIHNAQDWIGGTYTTLDGQVLIGSQSCELPEQVHSEIVDLAVLITAGDLSLPDYNFKQNKVALTQ